MGRPGRLAVVLSSAGPLRGGGVAAARAGPRAAGRRVGAAAPRTAAVRAAAPGRGLPVRLLPPVAGQAAPLAPGRRASCSPDRRRSRTSSWRPTDGWPVAWRRTRTGWPGTPPAARRAAAAGGHRVPAAVVRMLRSARVGHGLPPGRRRGAPPGSAAAARQRRHRRGGGAGAAAVHPHRRLPVLHPAAAPRNAFSPTRASQPSSSSRAACTRAWTCTSGRRPSTRSCRPSWWPTASRTPGRSGPSTCRHRRTTWPRSATRRCRWRPPRDGPSTSGGSGGFAESGALLRDRLVAALDALRPPGGGVAVTCGNAQDPQVHDQRWG